MAFMLGIGSTSLYMMLCGTVFLLLLFVFTQKRSVPRGLRLPPGPRGKLLIGNVADMPRHHQWETFTRWGKEYGGLVYVNVLGQPMVIVNTADVAHDLLEKRSSLYSDRFQFPMLNDLMGLSWNFPLMRYGDRWRRHRKVFQQGFSPTAITAYHVVQTKHTRATLQKFYDSPDDFMEHLRHLAGAIIMESVYGIQVLPKDDPYIEMAEKALAAVSDAGNPGTYLVDALPFLKYIPEWMPGAEFQTKARLTRKLVTEIRELPFMVAKEEFNAGTAKPSYSASSLEELYQCTDAPADEEEIIRNTAGAAYGAASDTVVSSTCTFILAMVLYPEVQRKAQAELDSVIGADRLPDFKDRENLPYINAVCKEVHRWEPPAPLGIAHKVMQDDVYGEYFIPGGSIVIANSWAILHDEKLYGPETDKFIPERFLELGVREPTPTFGFGRRLCPGRYMADNSLFIAIVSILKVFDIAHARDSDGNDIPVKASFSSGLFQSPEPFKCSIKLRSASAESLLLECMDE